MAKAKTRAREAERGRFGKQRAGHLEDRLAALMRAAFASGEIAYIGGLEAPLRHGIRATLCLGGRRWRAADAAAQAAVAGALRRVGAVRPTWNEGQPEWAVSSGDLIERTRCVECHKPLVGEQRKFCSRGCATRHHARLEYLRNATKDNVTWLAVRRI